MLFLFYLIPAHLSVILFALHCLRSGNILLFLAMLGALCVFPLSFIPRRWASKMIQTILALQTLEWLRTLVSLMGERMSEGKPWFALFCIIGGVTLFTFASIFLFMTGTMRAFYTEDETPVSPPSFPGGREQGPAGETDNDNPQP